MKLVYIDTETTGFDPKKNALVQIGFIYEEDGQVIGKKTYNIKPWEGCEWSQEAIDKTGITPEMAAGFQDSKEAFNHFTRVLGKYINRYDKNDKAFFVGYNAKFDEEFIRDWFVRNAETEKDRQYGNGYGCFFWTPCVDVMQFALFRTMGSRASFPNFQLGTVCQALGIEFDEKDAHNALYDITKTRELLLKLKSKS